MRLIMFDVDGTLTQSNDLDNAAFLQALDDAFQITLPQPDWTTFTPVTDAWILREIYRAPVSSWPTMAEVARFRRCLIDRLTNAITAAGGVQPIPGAIAAIQFLISQTEFAVAYAGGAWTDSARLKLTSAGLPHATIPAAFSDDAETREEICRIALERAETHYQQRFATVIYVGDGVWDVRASRTLGYPFIGVAYNCDPTPLVNEGATSILSSFQNMEQFISMLQSVR